MAGTAGIIAAALSALGGVAGGVAGAAHGGPPSPLSNKPQGATPYTPSAMNFGAGGGGAPQVADLRLSELLGQQRRRPEDEMTLGMMMGGY